MNMKKIQAMSGGLILALAVTHSIDAFQSEKECPAPQCFRLKALAIPDQTHEPGSHSPFGPFDFTGGNLDLAGNNNNNSHVPSATGANNTGLGF